MSLADNRAARRAQLSPAKQALLAQLKRGALAGAAGSSAIPRRPADSPIPLSFAQQRLWFLDQLAPGSASYNMALTLRLSGPLDRAALERSLNDLLRRHEALRTTFVAVDGQPQQVILPAAALTLTVVDLSAMPPAERQTEAERVAVAEVQRPFDLARDLLFRTLLLRLDEHEHMLVATSHHIVLDGSQALLLAELSALYNAHVAGSAAPLPALSIQYADYARWQRESYAGRSQSAAQDERVKADLAYWRAQLGGDLTPLQLPIARPRPPAQTFRGAKQMIALPAALLAALQTFSRQEDATLFMTLLAGFQCLLSRYSGQRQITVGTPAAQRSQPELEPLIGCFVNTLALRSDLDGNPTFREAVRRVREVTLGAFAHQQAPIEMLIDLLQPERDPSRNPLYQVMFTLQHATTSAAAFSGLRARSLDVDAATARLDLLLYMSVGDDFLRGVIEYNTDLFDDATIARLLRHFETLLTGAMADPDQRLADLPLLPAAERAQIVRGWNDTRADYDRTVCMHQLFERQAARTPDAPAVIFGDVTLSYAELNRRANTIAHQLRALGVGRGSMVAVWLERSHLMIPALLGILKAGAAYVPLEPALPAARVQFIVNSLAVRCVLTQTAQLPALAAMEAAAPALAHVLCLDTDAPAAEARPADLPSALQLWTGASLAAQPYANPDAAVSPDDLAYIIFTSGSTGTPKGVMVRHQPVINLIEWVNRTFNVGPDDRVLFVTSPSFDLSVYDIFGLLAAGGSIRVASRQDLHDPERLLQILCREPITFWDSAPAALQQLAPFLASAPADGVDRLRLVFLSGDWIPVTLPDQVRGVFTRAEMISLGGATEATVWSNFHPIGAVDPQWPSIPYGRPIQNAQYYILDAQLQPCPVGVPGELYIGGECLAEGYANDPILTAAKFIPDRFSDATNARLYRTGDQARFWADGTIEFLGRIDQQVKIRGFRIELGEIESVLSSHPAVQHCVVDARADGPAGSKDKRLVAYVVPEEPRIENQAPRAGTDGSRCLVLGSDLRAFLQERLPEYMIPSAFVMLDALPVTANGKLDRKALPAPEREDLGAAETLIAPRTAAEQTLAAIWSSVLRVEQIGIHDNFFVLGGDSILGIQIIARANQAGLRLAPRHLFQHQTIAKLAAVAGTAQGDTAEQGVVSGELPLTPIQRWFFEQRLPAPEHWNQAMLLQVPPDLDSALIERAAARLLEHHDALRLRFEPSESGWRQRNAATAGPGCFSRIDLSAVAADERAAAIEAAASEAQTSLNLQNGPLLRALHFHCGADAPGRLLLIVHHLAVDGVSWRILLEDLQSAYSQLQRDAAPLLPAKTSSFKQWAERLAAHAQSDEVRATLGYWRALPWQSVQPLPRDLPAGENSEQSARSVAVRLSQEQTRKLLLEAPEMYRTQINELLLTALARAVSGWTGASSVLVNLEGHGRETIFDDLDLSRTVGWFTAITPVLLTLPPDAALSPLLQAVKEQLRQVPQRGLSYGLLRYLGDDAIRESLQALPPAEISFNYLGQFDQALPAEALFRPVSGAIGPAHGPRGRRSHLLEINGLVADGQLQFGWSYSADVHQRATIERLAASFIETLQALSGGAETSETSYTPSDFPLANLSQRQLSAIAAKFSKKARS